MKKISLITMILIVLFSLTSCFFSITKTEKENYDNLKKYDEYSEYCINKFIEQNLFDIPTKKEKINENDINGTSKEYYFSENKQSFFIKFYNTEGQNKATLNLKYETTDYKKTIEYIKKIDPFYECLDYLKITKYTKTKISNNLNELEDMFKNFKGIKTDKEYIVNKYINESKDKDNICYVRFYNGVWTFCINLDIIYYK